MDSELKSHIIKIVNFIILIIENAKTKIKNQIFLLLTLKPLLLTIILTNGE